MRNGEVLGFCPSSSCLSMRMSLAMSSGVSIVMLSPSMVYCFGLDRRFRNASSMLLSVSSIVASPVYCLYAYIVTQLGQSTSNVVPSSLKKMYMSLVIAPSLTVTYFTRNGVVLLPMARYWTSWVMKCSSDCV